MVRQQTGPAPPRADSGDWGRLPPGVVERMILQYDRGERRAQVSGVARKSAAPGAGLLILEREMAFYAGFDTETYPGIDMMNWLQANTNLSWCGYYLAPAPNRSPTGWPGQFTSLSPQWGVVPIYVGQQDPTTGSGRYSPSSILTAAQGTQDGQAAANLAAGDQFPNGTCIYLDWESGGLTANGCDVHTGSPRRSRPCWAASTPCRPCGSGAGRSRRRRPTPIRGASPASRRRILPGAAMPRPMRGSETRMSMSPSRRALLQRP
jgi:hypothetical protein